MPEKIKDSLKRYYNQRIKPQKDRLMDDLMHPGNHPKQTALSMAIGVFVGIWIPIGFQLWTMLLLLTVIRYNFVIATIVSFISNPFTVLPIYYVAINIGEWLLQMDFSWHFFTEFIDNPMMDNLTQFGTNSLYILATGLTFMAVTLSLLTYTTALRVVLYLRARNQVS